MNGSKITNKAYREFLDKGIIQTIDIEQLNKVLNNIEHKNKPLARIFVIILYYSGARPNEILLLKTDDIKKEGNYLTILLQGSKRGLPRKIYLQTKNPHIQEIEKYNQSLPPNYVLFNIFANSYERKKKNNETRIETTSKIFYYIKKWTSGIINGEEGLSPYFFRHNRFSKLSEEGATLQEIRMIKGSRTYESVTPYLHMSSNISKKLAKKIK
jgi:site-specific recombinase XerD